MSSKQLKKQIFSDKHFSDTVKHLEKNDIVYTKGLAYSLRSFFIAYLFEKFNKKVIFLADTVESAEKTRDDLFSILKNRDNCEVFLPAENYPYCSSDIDDERKGNRLIALDKILSNKSIARNAEALATLISLGVMEIRIVFSVIADSSSLRLSNPSLLGLK